MSTKRTARTAAIIDIRRKLGAFELSWTLGDPLGASAASATHAASVALAVSVALLRALRDRGLLTEGEIDDLFGEAAERLRDPSALKLLSGLRGVVEYKEEE
jgi:hypothetical protein